MVADGAGGESAVREGGDLAGYVDRVGGGYCLGLFEVSRGLCGGGGLGAGERWGLWLRGEWGGNGGGRDERTYGPAAVYAEYRSVNLFAPIDR